MDFAMVLREARKSSLGGSKGASPTRKRKSPEEVYLERFNVEPSLLGRQ